MAVAVSYREMSLPVEKVTEMVGAGMGGLVNGAIWRFTPVNAPVAVMITGGLAVGGLVGSIFTKGVPSKLLGGLAAGSTAVLGFVAPLMLGVPATTSRKIKTADGGDAVIKTKMLPSPAGELIRGNIRSFLDLSVPVR